MSAAAEIEVERTPSRLPGWFASFDIVVDGIAVGSLRRGELKTFQVRPGRHEVQVVQSGFESWPVMVELAAGDRARLRCWCAMSLWSAAKAGGLSRIKDGAFDDPERAWLRIELLDPDQPD